MLQDKLSTTHTVSRQPNKVCSSQFELCSLQRRWQLSATPSNGRNRVLVTLAAQPSPGRCAEIISEEGASKKGTHPRPQWMKSRRVFLPKATCQNSSATFHSTKWFHDTCWSWTRQFLGKPHPWESLRPSVLEVSGLLLLTPLGQICLSFRMQFQTPWHHSCPFGLCESGLSPAGCQARLGPALRNKGFLWMGLTDSAILSVCGTERSTNPVPKCLYFQHQGGQCFTCSSY